MSLLLCGSAPRAAAQDDWWGADKALHFSVSAGLAGGGYALAVPIVDPAWARATIGASFSLTLGIAKELYDWSGAGDASWRDFTWDVIGTATGVLIALGVEWLVRALSEPRAAASPSPSRCSTNGSARLPAVPIVRLVIRGSRESRETSASALAVRLTLPRERRGG